jgi:hypothetical protein
MPQRRSIAIFRLARSASACACSAVAGCAVVPESVDLDRAAIVPGSAATRFVVNGSTSAGRGAGTGALSGAGGGAVAGTALCAATGPWFPLCMLAVVTSGAGIGAGVGAGIGANLKDSPEERQVKADLLANELSAGSYSSVLIAYLRREGQQRHIDLPLDGGTAPDATVTPPRWLVEVSLLEVATEGKERFEFQIDASMRVLRADGKGAVYERVFSESSDSELTMAQWTADDAAAVKREIDMVMQVLARRMLRELSRDPQNEYIAAQVKRRKQLDSTR